MSFDILTICVLAGVIGGPIYAWQGAPQPARPWSDLSRPAQTFGVIALCGSVAVIVVIAAVGRPLLALLLAGSCVLSYFVARYRRSR